MWLFLRKFVSSFNVMRMVVFFFLWFFCLNVLIMVFYKNMFIWVIVWSIWLILNRFV